MVEHLHPELHPEPTRAYLDIARGTGNYTVAVAQTGMHVYGIDQFSLYGGDNQRKEVSGG
jgi:ubiquinone/menaquinone biosynthesis C-methylase UbiE